MRKSWMTTETTGFSPERISQMAQENHLNLIYVTLAYLKDQGVNGREWATYVGNHYAQEWATLRGKGARVVLEYMALNVVSSGGKLYSLQGDTKEAEAKFEPWPPHDYLLTLGLTETDAAVYLMIGQSIANALGLSYGWQLDDQGMTLRVSTVSP